MSSLYLEHFRLTEPPFGITPNGKFFFEGQARGAVLDALQHAVMDEDGIVVVIGEVGSGKTMLSRMLAERLPRDQVDVVYLSNPSFGPREILLSLIADWGLQAPADGQPHVLTIQKALLERHAQGRRAVVLIDEAQAMQPASLEEIKLLSNLETAENKLLQIVLFGQPELDALLGLASLRQVRDRVVHRFELQPLNQHDAAAYIEHRLRRAGWQGGALFDPNALRRLIAASGGRIRAIHLLADKALLAAFAQGARKVGQQHARQAIAEFQGKNFLQDRAPSLTGQQRWTWRVTSAMMLTTLSLGAAVGYAVGQMNTAQTAHQPNAHTASANAVAKPAVLSPSSPAKASAPSVAASAMADTQKEARSEPEAFNAAAQRYEKIPQNLRDTIYRTRAVFDDTNQNFWVLQVGVANNLERTQGLIAKVQEAGLEVWIQDRAYLVKTSNTVINVWAVYAGRYPDRSSAVQSVQKWPASLQTYKPMPRSLTRIRGEVYPDRVPS